MSRELMAVLILVMAGALAVITITLIVMLTKGTQGPQGEVGPPGYTGAPGITGAPGRTPTREEVTAAVRAYITTDPEFAVFVVGAIREILDTPDGVDTILNEVRGLLAHEYGLTSISRDAYAPSGSADPAAPVQGENRS